MGAWTDYGKQRLFAGGIGAVDPPLLEVALYVGSADPAGTPVELTLTGYARAAVSFVLPFTDTANNNSDVVIGPMAVGVYQGVAIVDAGGVWFWDDEAAPVTIPASSSVTYAAGELTVDRTP